MVPSLPDPALDAISRILGDAMVGSDITRVFKACGILDTSGESTKWKRLYGTFGDVQRREARSSDQPHLALQAMLAVVRAIAFEIQSCGAADAQLTAMLRSAQGDVLDAANTLSAAYIERANAAAGLYEAAGGAALIVTYPILCAHVMDALVLQYFCGADDQAVAAADKLAAFASSEPGCAHPISDRYAVSVVWAIRVLHEAGHALEARALLKEAAVWLVDRYWQGGIGLAPCDAQEDEEIAQLLGGPFKGLDVKRQSGSLLSCALMDAAALLQETEVFEGLHADILAADIEPRYYQVRDTTGQFEYSAEDIVRFPNVEFAEHLPRYEHLAHANHLDGEPKPHLEHTLGNCVFAAVSLLMRDRYFPQTWLSRRAIAPAVGPAEST